MLQYPTQVAALILDLKTSRLKSSVSLTCLVDSFKPVAPVITPNSDISLLEYMCISLLPVVQLNYWSFFSGC